MRNSLFDTLDDLLSPSGCFSSLFVADRKVSVVGNDSQFQCPVNITGKLRGVDFFPADQFIGERRLNSWMSPLFSMKASVTQGCLHGLENRVIGATDGRIIKLVFQAQTGRFQRFFSFFKQNIRASNYTLFF